jgi:hypothetical protein
MINKDIQSEQKNYPDGKIEYIFRHEDVGEIGTCMIVPTPLGQSQINFHVSGDDSDPMAERRKELLQPIVNAMEEKMNIQYGTAKSESMKPYEMQSTTSVVESKMFPCNKCKAPTALFIFGEKSETVGELEDYARKMYAQVKEMNVPTWVLGREKEVIIDGEYAGESLVLKIHPKRLKAKKMNSIDLNAKIDKLMDSHCK